MNIEEKLKTINKLIKDKNNLMFDYFHFFKQQEISSNYLYKKWEEFIYLKKREDIESRFYLHIPFCSTICKYCMFNKKILSSKNEVNNYIENIKNFLSKYTLLFKNIKFKGFYVGGGTPSLLDTEQFENLFSYIFSNFKFNEEYYKSIELNPSSTTFEKLKKLKNLGFDRISFGVQSFQKDTIKTENRPYVSPERLKNIIEEAKSLGFQDINIDLLIGLNNEKINDIINNVEKVNYIDPYNVYIYPLFKSRERSILHNGDEDMFVNNLLKIHKKIINNKKILKNYNIYNTGNLGETILKNKKKYNEKKEYNAISQDKESLFGVGYKVYGKIWGIGSYKSGNFIDDNMIHYFEQSTFKTEMYSYILKKFQDIINKKDFEKKFSYKINDLFKEEFNFLEKKGIIKEDKNNIYFMGRPDQLYYGLILLDEHHLMLFIKNNFFNKDNFNIHEGIK